MIPDEEFPDDKWKRTFEYVEPHSLCCCECKAALVGVERLTAEVERLKQQLARARMVCSYHRQKDGNDCEECRQMVQDVDAALSNQEDR